MKIIVAAAPAIQNAVFHRRHCRPWCPLRLGGDEARASLIRAGNSARLRREPRGDASKLFFFFRLLTILC